MSSRVLKHSSQSLGIDSSMSSTDRPLEKIAQSHATMKRKAMKDRTESTIEAKKINLFPRAFPSQKRRGTLGTKIAEEFGPSLTDEP